jgi:hypothetical protein
VAGVPIKKKTEMPQEDLLLHVWYGVLPPVKELLLSKTMKKGSK